MKKMMVLGSLVLALVLAGCSEDSNVAVDDSATSGAEYNNNNNNNNNSVVSGSMDEMEGYTGSSTHGMKSVYFGFDKFNVDSEGMDTINSNVNIINNSGLVVRVEGNADERGSDEYNYALALKRASAVKDGLVNSGVSADKIKLVSYGESKPKCIEQTKECYRENRRVDFVLLNK